MPRMDPGLLQAILENPDDDLPRLLTADWLEDNGQAERSEFIRAQCELSMRREYAGDSRDRWSVELTARIDKLRSRSIELLRGWNTCNFFPELMTLPRNGTATLITTYDQDSISIRSTTWASRIRRGFVEQVTCRADHWLAHGDAIAAEHPIRRVAMTTQWPINYPILERRWPRIQFALPAFQDSRSRRDRLIADAVAMTFVRHDGTLVSAEPLMRIVGDRIVI